MSRARRIGLAALIGLSCVAGDQVTKQIATRELAGSPPILLLNGLILLRYSENTGAFLGMGSNWPAEVRLLVMVILSGAGLLAVLAYIGTAEHLTSVPLVGLSLLLGGGVSNLLDRILHGGAVTDFVRLGSGFLRTGIFNLADVAILAGALLVAVWAAGAREEARELGSADG
jgi:signal peptidase II